MDEELRAFYDDVVSKLERPGLPHITMLDEGQMVGPFTSMFNFPQYGEPLFRLQLSILKQNLVPQNTIELFILVVACAEKAAYAIYAHELLAIDAGVPPQVVIAIKEGREPELVSQEEKTAYALAVALSKGGVVPEAVFEEALGYFGAEGLNVLVNTAALFKYLSTLMNAYDEPVPGV